MLRFTGMTCKKVCFGNIAVTLKVIRIGYMESNMTSSQVLRQSLENLMA